ncbi:AAA family ATPase [uncultured Moraxella sp.]|uniref:AAA family ATPase n=1 Tax=uncultured Moraxella sp. TaxID=263769 RepID=UPI0025CE9962|nr:AAA family ATPase [uncultured Moraxella sp.]
MKQTKQWVDVNQVSLSPYAEYMVLHAYFGCDCGIRFDEYLQQCGKALGVIDDVDEIDRDDYAKIKQRLDDRYQTIKRTGIADSDDWQQPYENIACLAEFLALSDDEIAFLRLALHTVAEEVLRELLQQIKKDYRQLLRFVAKLLDCDETAIRFLMTSKNQLRKFGILAACYRYGSNNYTHASDLLDWGDCITCTDFLMRPISKDELVKQCVMPVASAGLLATDFAYMDEHYQMMAAYLRHAYTAQKSGVNILLYGAPGTGKTQLASVLAEQLGVAGLAVTHQDDDQDPLSAKSRLYKLRLSQALLDKTSTLLIFDEIEDVFAANAFDKSVGQAHKAWVNHQLETNPVPTIWISNDIDMMDRAFLRRFDLVVQMPDLSVAQKAAQIKAQVGDRLSDQQIAHFAQVKSLSVGMIERIFGVAMSVDQQGGHQNFDQLCLMMVNEVLKSRGAPTIQAYQDKKSEFRLEYVSCQSTLAKISDGIKVHKTGRILCYGEPGSGKSEWAKWLALQMDVPLHLYRASDLMSKYVGETEQNIAAAFKLATQTGGVLMIDEVDSLLFDREQAQRHWERTQVNEMLTQMEDFEGVMIVSTNAKSVLDMAAMRRFDVKLEFGYLTAEQCCAIADEMLSELELGALNDTQRRRLSRLSNLTMGDFVAVRRRHRLATFASAGEWLDGVYDESMAKQDNLPQPMGFVA